MKHEITFYKDTGHEALRGKTVELFKISWHEGPGIWVRDEGGKYWGMYKLGTQEVRRLNVPERLGHITSVEEEGAFVDPLLAEDILASVEEEPEYFSLPENQKEEEGVDHLEAEDISITPEGLNLKLDDILGEEEEQ